MPKADLTVDYAMLAHSAQSLRLIATEFDGADARRDANTGIWGSCDVARAMNDFVDNWDRHRGKLVESINNVGGMCAGAKEALTRVDHGLADSMIRSGKG
ncbi:MAG: hypothetical protein ACRDSR_23200 [Pseudonocardiaceae bacterium]